MIDKFALEESALFKSDKRATKIVEKWDWLGCNSACDK